MATFDKEAGIGATQQDDPLDKVGTVFPLSALRARVLDGAGNVRAGWRWRAEQCRSLYGLRFAHRRHSWSTWRGRIHEGTASKLPDGGSDRERI